MKFIAISIIIIALAAVSYSVLVRNGNDVVFILHNDLRYAVFQDQNVTFESNATHIKNDHGAVVTVFGNITNNKPFDVTPSVGININDSWNWHFFYIEVDHLKTGKSLYFSWAYHLDRFNVSAAKIEIDVMAIR